MNIIEQVKLALNYALMLEMIKAKGYSASKIVSILDEYNEELLETCGEGIPSWKTLLEYYQENKDKIHQALGNGYEIGFLTKGALKSLLTIKFGLMEGTDFVDTGEFLRDVTISRENLRELQSVIAKNWTIIPKEENMENKVQLINIKLTYKAHF